jgi:hypothetical protein
MVSSAGPARPGHQIGSHIREGGRVPGVSGDAGLERAEAPPSSGLRANIAVTKSSLERFSQVRDKVCRR